MSVKVTVKWNKETYNDVEVDTSQPPVTLKMQLFSLTGVPPERQKIMGVKGGLLKDDADWATVGLKEGQRLMLMGSAEKVDPANIVSARLTVQCSYITYCSRLSKQSALGSNQGKCDRLGFGLREELDASARGKVQARSGLQSPLTQFSLAADRQMPQVPEPPTTALTFVEDLPEDEQDVEGYSKYGAGA